MKTAFGLLRPIWLIVSGIFMSLILYSSTQSTPQIVGLSQSFIDHLLDYAHIPIYSLLTFLLLLALCSFDFRRQMVAFVIAVLFGILNEGVQQYIPGRSCSGQDMLNNTLGALLTIITVQYFIKTNLKVGSKT